MSRCSECERPLTQCDCVADDPTVDRFAANMILALEMANDTLTARLTALEARSAKLESALWEIAKFRACEATPAAYAGALGVVKRKAAAALASEGP
jgi:hypothetical protein